MEKWDSVYNESGQGARAAGVPEGFLEEVSLRKDGLYSQTILSSKSLAPGAGHHAQKRARRLLNQSNASSFSCRTESDGGICDSALSAKCSGLGTNQGAQFVCFAKQPPKETAMTSWEVISSFPFELTDKYLFRLQKFSRRALHGERERGRI